LEIVSVAMDSTDDVLKQSEVLIMIGLRRRSR